MNFFGIHFCHEELAAILGMGGAISMGFFSTISWIKSKFSGAHGKTCGDKKDCEKEGAEEEEGQDGLF